MIEFAHGNLLEAHADALVNTVNTVGVMGKGIALQFKKAFPEAYRQYVRACSAQAVRLGEMYVVEVGGLGTTPRYVVHFPTKKHWRSKSRLRDIEVGLADLTRTVRRLGIQSIALPPLGCGNGGLDWSLVRPLIEDSFGPLDDVRVLVFEPRGAPAPTAMPDRTAPPEMTLGRAALVLLMKRYQDGMLDPFVSLLEVHKLMYFLQASGHELKLAYAKGKYGPYAENLRHVLNRIEGHFVSGFGDAYEAPEKPLRLLDGVTRQAEDFLATAAKAELHGRLDRVGRLISGFEDPLGMELLASVHWVLYEDPARYCEDAEATIAAVHRWNSRKRKVLKPEPIRIAWRRLKDLGWSCI